MDKQRAGRNRTVTLNNNETEHYFNMCLNAGALSGGRPCIDAVICGDIFDVSANLPSGFVDLLIVDPPYNLTKTFGGSEFKRIDDCEYADYVESWLLKLKHTLKPFATVYICCDWRSSITIGAVLQKHFTIQNRITWQREKGRGAAHNWKNSMEDIWFATVHPKNYTFNADSVKMRRKVIAPYKVDGKPKDWVETPEGNYRDTFASNFWDDISIPYWSMPENTDHPTQKPEKLIAKLILASSNTGGMVFDPFLGSGTTAVVAKKLGRRYLGVECQREYCALAQKRLGMAEGDKEIQGFRGGIFWERNTLALQQKLTNGKS